MNAPQKSRLRNILSNGLFLILCWGVIILTFGSALYYSHWSFRNWLSEMIDIIWPVAFIVGLLLLLAAHATRITTKSHEEAYPFMKFAALSFMLSAFALWLHH